MNPQDVKNYTTLGFRYEKEGNWAEAKKLYENAHQLDSASPMIAAELAYLYLDHGGDINLAVSLAQKARQQQPGSPQTADALGWAYYRLGSVNTAIAQLEESARKAPENPLYQYHMGMAYLAARNFDSAGKSLRQALKQDPNAPYAANIKSALEEVANRRQ